MRLGIIILFMCKYLFVQAWNCISWKQTTRVWGNNGWAGLFLPAGLQITRLALHLEVGWWKGEGERVERE